MRQLKRESESHNFGYLCVKRGFLSWGLRLIKLEVSWFGSLIFANWDSEKDFVAAWSWLCGLVICSLDVLQLLDLIYDSLLVCAQS